MTMAMNKNNSVSLEVVTIKKEERQPVWGCLFSSYLMTLRMVYFIPTFSYGRHVTLQCVYRIFNVMMVMAAKMMVTIQKRTVILASCSRASGRATLTVQPGSIF